MFAAVALGAFGAHGLRQRLTPEMLAVFETGVRYHVYHALGLFAVAWIADKSATSLANAAGWGVSRGDRSLLRIALRPQHQRRSLARRCHAARGRSVPRRVGPAISRRCQMTAEHEDTELVYVGDPLCSWCWGFAPSLSALRRDYPDRFRYRLVVGGLRTGASAPRVDGPMRAYLAQAWKEVERRSGQRFNHEFLETADFVYDTEPACRAVVAARHVSPQHVFDYNEALQEAFYRRSFDPTSHETFVTVAREQGLDELAFQRALASDDVRRDTHADFDEARAMGIHGFPSLVIKENGSARTVTRGWLAPEALSDELAPWLD